MNDEATTVLRETVRSAMVRSLRGGRADAPRSLPKHPAFLQRYAIKPADLMGPLLQSLIGQEPDLELLTPPALPVAEVNFASVKRFMLARQDPFSGDNTAPAFSDFCDQVTSNREEKGITTKIKLQTNDVAFRCGSGKIVYCKAFYDDCFRTGQVDRMHRDFLMTYAGLVNYYGITDPADLRPVLYYFTNLKRWSNNYVPSSNVYHGEGLFEEYFPSLLYKDVDAYLRSLGDDAEIIKSFDDLYQKNRYGDVGAALPKDMSDTSEGDE